MADPVEDNIRGTIGEMMQHLTKAEMNIEQLESRLESVIRPELKEGDVPNRKELVTDSCEMKKDLRVVDQRIRSIDGRIASLLNRCEV